MRDRYHNDLDQIVDRLLQLFGSVESAIGLATQALLEADHELADQVVMSDQATDALCREIESIAIELQMRQQPVAYDLRLLLTTQRIVADLERSGDLAKNIAKQARRRHPDHVVPEQMRGTVAAMGKAAEGLLNKAHLVFENEDAELARLLDAEDDYMDALHRELLAEVIGNSRTESVETAVDLTLIGRFYERFADHAVAIARQVVYLSTGELA
ncbi:phosphate signaling complex protein PhoU [Pimelobacter simplex]|uniref:Phosphate-specific transport system accessory protein PhoU n=1 Tax=Nocardioides simplex TaxID=2045 RepID=A0A7J5DYC3_NOCSI|nr:phosphate signaling complex protein PhoU [Pimelobacter simplex]KAB2810980.1 phosphate signaling complex protein PhoU [Pimelobacter simplex]